MSYDDDMDSVCCVTAAACPSGCTTCTSTTVCSTCRTGYAKKPDSTACLREFIASLSAVLNLLDSKGNYSATSNNTKLVLSPLMVWMLHLVQRGWDWAGPQPAQALLAVPNVTAHPLTASVPIIVSVALWF